MFVGVSEHLEILELRFPVPGNPGQIQPLKGIPVLGLKWHDVHHSRLGRIQPVQVGELIRAQVATFQARVAKLGIVVNQPVGVML